MTASTRTEGRQDAMAACPGCEALFLPKRPTQRFCGPKCRVAYSRDVGIVGALVSSRRLKRRASVILHVEDFAVLEAPIGARYRLVREP